MVHAFNPSAGEAEAEESLEFKAILMDTVSSMLTGATLLNLVLKNKTT